MKYGNFKMFHVKHRKELTMIQSKLGEVKLTKPNYQLCELLQCSKEDVDISVKSGLIAYLCSILKALELEFDPATAFEMWTKAATIIAAEEET